MGPFGQAGFGLVLMVIGIVAIALGATNVWFVVGGLISLVAGALIIGRQL